MKRKDIYIGSLYIAKVSGRFVPVKIMKESIYGGWDGINLRTQRPVRIKTAGRLRYALARKPQCLTHEQHDFIYDKQYYEL